MIFILSFQLAPDNFFSFVISYIRVNYGGPPEQERVSKISVFSSQFQVRREIIAPSPSIPLPHRGEAWI
jgi:hypothetical protein